MTKKPTTQKVSLSRDESWLLKCPLRMFRSARDVTQADIAVAIGKSTQSVRNWEMGNTMPSDDNFALLCQIMDMDHVKLKSAWEEWMKAGKRTAA